MRILALLTTPVLRSFSKVADLGAWPTGLMVKGQRAALQLFREDEAADGRYYNDVGPLRLIDLDQWCLTDGRLGLVRPWFFSKMRCSWTGWFCVVV